MRYPETKDQSAELLRQVLALMGQHDAAFNPVSYAVWYEHAAGMNARLSRAIELTLQATPRLGDEAMIGLYHDHVAAAEATAMERISTDLQRMMAEMAQGALRTGDRASVFGEQLSGLSEALGSSDPAALSQLVTQALAETVQMKSAAQELEQQVLVSRQEIARLQNDLVRARDEAVLDPLTGVLNRKGFDRQLADLLAQPPGPGGSHCPIMLDIDHFKTVNDNHGHVMGDRVLQALGEVLRNCVVDQSHSVARYGGEEFAILLPHCTVAASVKLAEAVRQRTRAMRIRNRRTQDVVLTVSISGGVAAMQADDDAQSLVARADAALYRSKQSGRDRITCA